MKAITVNQRTIEKYKLKTINDVYDLLSSIGVNVLMISAERSSLGYNYHYHVLANDFNEDVERELWLNAIYNDTVKNEVAYYDYIAKEGNYKLFNDYQKPYKTKELTQYELMLNDIYINDVSPQEIRLKYPTLFVRHFNTIMKMYMLKDGSM